MAAPEEDMTHKPRNLKLPAAVSVAVVALVCIASAVTAGGQVVDHDKVVEDPQLDYRKYAKQIDADEKATNSHQAAAISSVALSVGADEAAFHASLAAEAQSLNAATPVGATPDGTAPADAADSAAAAPIAPEPSHGLSIGVLIALGITGLVIALLAVLGLSAMRRRKSRRRHRQPEEKSVSLVEFARKRDTGKTED